MFRILLFLSLIVLVLGQGSWQSYVDEQLIKGGLTRAAVIGHDGSVWAISHGFSLKDGEGRALASLFKNPSNAFSKGITLAGNKYLGFKADLQSIYGKKGSDGVVTVKTRQAILIGVYGERIQPGNAALLVETLGDHIRENGY